jgi:hypothetical protein
VENPADFLKTMVDAGMQCLAMTIVQQGGKQLLTWQQQEMAGD